jgi:hypothetical protein
MRLNRKRTARTGDGCVTVWRQAGAARTYLKDKRSTVANLCSVGPQVIHETYGVNVLNGRHGAIFTSLAPSIVPYARATVNVTPIFYKSATYPSLKWGKRG